MQTLHHRIKSTRLGQNLSQAELAKKTGVSQPTVANWENGSHIPRKEALNRISTSLGVESDWLLSGDYAKAHNSVQDYLSQPIRHVPIYKWPEDPDTLFTRPPEGYLTYPTESTGAFALLETNRESAGRVIWIIDQNADTTSSTDIYLWADKQTLALAPNTGKPTGLKALGQLKAEIKTY